MVRGAGPCQASADAKRPGDIAMLQPRLLVLPLAIACQLFGCSCRVPTAVEDETVEAIAKWGGRSEGKPVNLVELAGTNVTDGDVKLLQDPQFAEVQTLDLASTMLTDDALHQIKPLKKIRDLYLSGTRV